MATEKQIRANRENANKSTGPRTLKGKTNSSRNAGKHGLTAAGLSELDDIDAYYDTLRQLDACFNPQGPVETFLVERLARAFVRDRRAALLEAEYINSELHAPRRESDPYEQLATSVNGPITDPGLIPRMPPASVGFLATTLQRYQLACQRSIFQILHELERLQRLRKGESIPAPMVGDLIVHAEAPTRNASADEAEGSEIALEMLEGETTTDATPDLHSKGLCLPIEEQAADEVGLSELIEAGPSKKSAATADAGVENRHDIADEAACEPSVEDLAEEHRSALEEAEIAS